MDQPNKTDTIVEEVEPETVKVDMTVQQEQASMRQLFSRENSKGGRERFKELAKRVINVHRFAGGPDRFWEVGAEAGVDVNSMDYDEIHCDCKISCVDFNKDRYALNEELSNKNLQETLNKRPEWSKVRWININGISWDVIKTIALKYELHPLSVEDCLHVPQRIKVDHYPNHLYLSLTLHTLLGEGGTNMAEVLAQATSGDNNEPKYTSPSASRKNLLEHGHQEGSKYLEAHRILRKEKLNVSVEQVSIFLLNDGTLITMFQHSGSNVCNPILGRIKRAGTLLRTAAEVSLLMEAVIDAVVDLALPIMDSYRAQIADLEGKVLIKPKMSYTRELHIISGELALLRRTLAPTQGLVKNLTTHDSDGFITAQAKTYFTDVLDHCNEIVEDLDTMNTISENLINLIFNTIACETNESMRILAIVTVIFAPMTFIAGVFGMNFEHFGLFKDPNGLAVFGYITAATTVLVLIVFTYIYWMRWLSQLHHWGKDKLAGYRSGKPNNSQSNAPGRHKSIRRKN